MHGLNEREALRKRTKLTLFAWIYPKAMKLSCVYGFNELSLKLWVTMLWIESSGEKNVNCSGDQGATSLAMINPWANIF